MAERHGPVLLAALAVAMRARTGGLIGHEVDDMRIRAEELLERDDELRRAIMGFATGYELHRHDPAAVAELGEELDRNIERDLRPVPPDIERRDIHG